MKDFCNYENGYHEIPDDEVIFYDGMLYIISRDKSGYIDAEGLHEDEYSIVHKCICPEYDEPI